MTDTDNQILNAVTLLLYHPVWDADVTVSAEVFEAQLQHCPYVGEYDADEAFHSGTLFSDCEHTDDNLIGKLWCLVRENGMIRQVSAFRPILLPIRSTYPFEEVLNLLEHRFGKPVTYARQDMFFSPDSSSNVYVYSTPLGEVRIVLQSNISDPSNPAAKVEVILSPGLDVQ